MSSGFVSAGTTDEPDRTNDEWDKAKQELEASRRRREEEARQGGGRSLYETLQANKAAKQEAFEESIRLKNQFRSLDEDEVEFLDSVLESTRAQEEAVKKETTEKLDVFRRQQVEADKALLADSEDGQKADNAGAAELEQEQWVVSGRKRKKGADKEALKGIKIRRSSSSGEPSRKDGDPPVAPSTTTNGKAATTSSPDPPKPVTTEKPPGTGLLGLNYSSDDDD